MSLHQIVLTQGYHCSRDAVIGLQLHCPYIKNVLTTSVLTKTIDCTEQGQMRLALLAHGQGSQLTSACIFYEIDCCQLVNLLEMLTSAATCDVLALHVLILTDESKCM